MLFNQNGDGLFIRIVWLHLFVPLTVFSMLSGSKYRTSFLPMAPGSHRRVGDWVVPGCKLICLAVPQLTHG